MIAEAAAKLSISTYVVGGYVRDLIMERESEDIDIVAVGSGIDLARKFSENNRFRNKSYDIQKFRNCHG